MDDKLIVAQVGRGGRTEMHTVPDTVDERVAKRGVEEESVSDSDSGNGDDDDCGDGCSGGNGDGNGNGNGDGALPIPGLDLVDIHEHADRATSSVQRVLMVDHLMGRESGGKGEGEEDGEGEGEREEGTVEAVASNGEKDGKGGGDWRWVVDGLIVRGRVATMHTLVSYRSSSSTSSSSSSSNSSSSSSSSSSSCNSSSVCGGDSTSSSRWEESLYRSLSSMTDSLIEGKLSWGHVCSLRVYYPAYLGSPVTRKVRGDVAKALAAVSARYGYTASNNGSKCNEDESIDVCPAVSFLPVHSLVLGPGKEGGGEEWEGIVAVCGLFIGVRTLCVCVCVCVCV